MRSYAIIFKNGAYVVRDISETIPESCLVGIVTSNIVTINDNMIIDKKKFLEALLEVKILEDAHNNSKPVLN